MPTINLQVAAGSDDARQATDDSVVLNTVNVQSDATTIHIGNRFLNVTIPPGATITSAKFSIKFPSTVVDEPKHQLRGELSLNPATFTTTPDDIDSRPRTTAVFTWDVSNLGVLFIGEEWEWGAPAGQPTNGTDISTLIQEIIDQPGWASGNALVLIYEQFAPDDGLRDLGQLTYESDPNDAALLTITYSDPPAPPPPTPAPAPSQSPAQQLARVRGGDFGATKGARYMLRLLDTFGNQIAIITEYRSLSFQHAVNGLGNYRLEMDGTDPDLRALTNLFTLDTQLEVYREDIASGIPRYLEFSGLHRTPQRYVDSRGQEYFVSYGRGYNDFLNRRIIAYPAGSSGAIKSGAAETVMKAFVNENLGPSAVSPPRDANGVMSGLVIANDDGNGNSWSGSRPRQNLYDVLVDISDAVGGDFAVVRTGPATWEFRTYFPQLGTDRTLGNAAGLPPVIFALNLGNMGLPQFAESHIEEKNRIFVLGQGLEDQRAFRVREDVVAQSASPWNLSEVSRNANQESTDAGLDSVGDALLEELGTQRTFGFEAVQTGASRYGRDYFLGDVVTAKFREFQFTRTIEAVEIHITPDNPDYVKLILSH